MSEDKAFLTIVEEFKGIKLSQIVPNIFDPNFWLPFIPLKEKKLNLLENGKKFGFEVKDVIILDMLGTLKQELDAKGQIIIEDKGPQPNQAKMWEIYVKVENFDAEVWVRIRARDIPTGLKVGIYVYKLRYDWGLLKGFGEDAILFGTRTKLRESIDLFLKKNR